MFSVTRRDDAQYWTEGSYDDWLAEMAGARDGWQRDWFPFIRSAMGSYTFLG